MNSIEYAEYKSTVDSNLKGIEHVSSGPVAGCDECLEVPDCEHCGASFDPDNGGDPPEEWHDLAAESHFSKHPCEVCGCTLAGDRYPVHGADTSKDEEMVHFDACSDCVYYLEHGRLDDETMEEVEA